MNNAQLINQDSGIQEYYTPPRFIEAARAVMGYISLDPASSEAANRIVQARYIFTRDDDGLTKRWFGNVWLNHPYGRKENRLWISKLVDEYIEERVHEAIGICFASTSEKWIRPLMIGTVCFVRGRVKFLKPDLSEAGASTKGSMIYYLGDRSSVFADHFRQFGEVKISI